MSVNFIHCRKFKKIKQEYNYRYQELKNFPAKFKSKSEERNPKKKEEKKRQQYRGEN